MSPRLTPLDSSARAHTHLLLFLLLLFAAHVRHLQLEEAWYEMSKLDSILMYEGILTWHKPTAVVSLSFRVVFTTVGTSTFWKGRYSYVTRSADSTFSVRSLNARFEPKAKNRHCRKLAQ